VTLVELLASLGKPPHRVAGIPAGIISEDDFDVTEEAFAALAAFPELARLALDMGDALRKTIYSTSGWTGPDVWWKPEADALLARLERITDSRNGLTSGESLDGIADKNATQ
jgi:hypothetical protein